MIATTAKEHPLGPIILDEEFAITCDLPTERAEAMRGSQGERLAEVEGLTGTRIRFEPVPECAELHSLLIEGPLLEVYRAHAMMMGRYHEAAQEAAEAARQAAEQAAQEAAEQAEADGAGDLGEHVEEAEAEVEAEALEEAPDAGAAAPDAAKVNALRQQLEELQERLAKAQGQKSAGKGKPGSFAPADMAGAGNVKGKSKGRPKGKGKGKGKG